MPRALWNGALIAQTEKFETVEGNIYFPPEAISKECFVPSETQTVCGWKGTANYFDVVVGGKTNKDAAWYYADPKPAAQNIKGHIAFWRGVVVED